MGYDHCDVYPCNYNVPVASITVHISLQMTQSDFDYNHQFIYLHNL